MRSRSSPVLYFGFGSLVVLIGLAGLGAARRATQLYSEMESAFQTHQETTRVFEEIRAGINRSGIYVRDYLLDPSAFTASLHRQRLLEIRTEMGKELEQLEKLVGAEGMGTLSALRTELDGYWDSFEPLFTWTPVQKMAKSSLFLQQIVIPKRDAALDIATRIRDISEQNFKAQQDKLRQGQIQFRRYLAWMLGVAVSLGVIVAAISIFRISRLERETAEHQRRTERAQQELRRLSQELVRAQEDERRSISRELHDQVGQMVTALRMELASLEQMRSASPAAFSDRLREAKYLAEQTLVSVRDLAMGLRPAMLDDLGLGPALEWQGREFSRRCGFPVEVQLDGDLEALPDAHRTCIFRIVQEAMTNCARHAKAKNVRVAVHGGPDSVSVSVQDDGVGIDGSEASSRGLGMIGIEERARELGGYVKILSQQGKGTTLHAEIPRSKGVSA